MKLTVIRPIYVEGKVLVEGDVFETLEQHGRELVKKGYAEQIGDDAGAEAKADAEIKGKAEAEADAKAQAQVDAEEKADANSKAKTKSK